MGKTLSIFLSDTSEAVGTKLGHNSPLVDNLKKIDPTGAPAI